jgi:hypothetical protein
MLKNTITLLSILLVTQVTLFGQQRDSRVDKIDIYTKQIDTSNDSSISAVFSLDSIQVTARTQKNKITATCSFEKSKTLLTIDFYSKDNALIAVRIKEQSPLHEKVYRIAFFYYENGKIIYEDYWGTRQLGMAVTVDGSGYGYNTNLTTEFEKKLVLLLFDKIEQLPFQTKVALFLSGKEDYQGGWLITALDYFSEAIKLDSFFASAYYYRGLTYIKGARSDCYLPAVNDFYKCIELQPDSNYWQAYEYLASQKIFPDTAALWYYNKAILFNPTNYILYQQRGFLKGWNGMLSSALMDYDKAIDLNNKDAQNYDLRASIKIQTGNFEGALIDNDKAIKLSPEDSKLYFDKSYILCHLNQIKKARKF